MRCLPQPDTINMSALNVQELANHMQRIYDLLVDMQHIPASWIKSPLYDLHSRYDEVCQLLGLTETAVLLIKSLPYIDRDRPSSLTAAIMPDTPAVNYADPSSLSSSRDPLNVRMMPGDTDYVDGWMIPLTLGYRQGTHLMLDTRTGMITEWQADHHVRLNPEDLATDPPLSLDYRWRGQPTAPAREVLSKIFENLRSLRWTPVDSETIEYTEEGVISVDEGYCKVNSMQANLAIHSPMTEMYTKGMNRASNTLSKHFTRSAASQTVLTPMNFVLGRTNSIRITALRLWGTESPGHAKDRINVDTLEDTD